MCGVDNYHQFQHTAARRRLPGVRVKEITPELVSTHSRAEAAAGGFCDLTKQERSFNTQPRGGGCQTDSFSDALLAYVSTHSRAEAAASGIVIYRSVKMFQHTAARRRLLYFTKSNQIRSSCFNTQPRGGGCSHIFFNQ